MANLGAAGLKQWARPSASRARSAADKERILQAACQSFSRDNYDRVGLREIAASAGVDPALVGHYFGGKAGLFKSALRALAASNPLASPAAENISHMLPRLAIGEATDEGDIARRFFVTLLRSSGSPEAKAVVADFLRQEALEPLSA